MKKRERVHVVYAPLLVFAVAAATQGGVIEFDDRDAWINAVGAFTTIDFTGHEDGEYITDQYARLGVLFADGNDTFFYTPSFVNDGWGLDGNGNITVVFDTPMAYIGVDFPGVLRIELFSEGHLVYSSSKFGGGGLGHFVGLISTQPFDMAVLMDVPPSAEAEIDDLHFGPPDPGKCPADLDGDGSVGILDLLLLLSAWGTNPIGPPDLDGDGNVGILDLLTLLTNWGPC